MQFFYFLYDMEKITLTQAFISVTETASYLVARYRQQDNVQDGSILKTTPYNAEYITEQEETTW